MRHPLFAVLALVAAVPDRQDPGEALAHYRLGDKPAIVTRVDVAVEMAFHLRRKDEGRQACAMLVDSFLTRRAAERAKMMPAEAEVSAFWDKLQEQFRAAGKRPEDFPAVRNSTPAELRQDFALQLAQERLVRKALGLAAGEAVGGAMLQLWIADERKRATIVEDPDLLPPGTAARVDGKDLPMVELGLLLFRTCEDREREQFVHQVVYLDALEHRAHERGIEATPDLVDAAIAARRAMAAKDPRYAKITFEQLLQTQGLSVGTLAASRVFRAKVLEEQLALATWPDAKLRDELAADREAVLRRAGPRRHLGVIFRRALEEPNALVPDDFAGALQRLEKVKARLAGAAFGDVARIETDDPGSKANGGDVGWHARASTQLPGPVLEAAFAAAVGDVVGPIAGPDGCYLAKVLGAEGELDETTVLQRLRELHQGELVQQILDDAHLEWPHQKAGDK